MSAAVSAERPGDDPPLLQARVAGAQWLAVITAGVPGVVVARRGRG